MTCMPMAFTFKTFIGICFSLNNDLLPYFCFLLSSHIFPFRCTIRDTIALTSSTKATQTLSEYLHAILFVLSSPLAK